MAKAMEATQTQYDRQPSAQLCQQHRSKCTK